MPMRVDDQVLRRGEAGYEDARRATTWHAGTPDRFPEVLVRARDEDDVVAAVRLARDEGRQMAACSGGHSWSGSHLRDGIVPVNRPRRFVSDDHLRRLDEIRAQYDPDGRFVSWLGRPEFADAPR
ncbi:FAD-binding protein [Streptomyces sp. NPDC019937]|uniref:FAD-binding protein n=1 Tax=Streptomyces sp. NPDC019937 TaxID=3154787 RepID=UPI0033FC379C